MQPERSIAEETLPHGVPPPEEVARVPQRPLGLLSDYAATGLAEHVTAVRTRGESLDDFAAKCESLAHDAACVRVDPASLPLALHDVSMLSAAVRGTASSR